MPILPHDLRSDIQQFVESDFAKRYFSTHRTGFIFRRTVPVTEMMSWQKVLTARNLLPSLSDCLPVGPPELSPAFSKQGSPQECGSVI